MLSQPAPRSNPSRHGSPRRLVALVPLAALSMSWTVAIADVRSGGLSLDAASDPAPAPAVAVPERTVEVPASVQRSPRSSARGIRPVVRRTGTGGDVPAVALAAYQRAEAIIDRADDTCGLDWTLLAAIGKVESDHGRVGGGRLTASGAAAPAVVGIPLDGRRGTAVIHDTDAGELDGDERFDRALGPMQFIPTTWGVVGVDADGDGVRNVQDVDDAALAAAVYLCSGDGRLSEPGGLRSALRRYNDSAAYVRQVMVLMDGYEAAGIAPVSAGMAVAAGYAGASTPVPASAAGRPAVTGSPELRTPEPRPASPASPGPAGGHSSGDGQDRPGGADAPQPQPSAPIPRSPLLEPLAEVLAHTEAALRCTLRGLTALTQPAAYRECVEDLTR